MTVGYHAPPPGASTGVADYASALFHALRQRGHVELNATTADVHLYHLGNNQLHREIYQRAMQQPGVIVLHDAVLHHFYLGALDRESYIEEYVYNYGGWERGLAEDLWRERAGSGMDVRYFARPMLRRVGEQATTVVVHNRAAMHAVLAHAPGANVIEIPHLFERPPNGIIERAVVRSRLGSDGKTFVFGVFGHLRESKRILPILNCFERLHRRHGHIRLLLAGSFASKDLERAVEPWLAHPGVTRVAHLDDQAFWNITNAVDACLNLRYPSAGETSGIGVRLMGLGKAVIFTEGAEIAGLPEDTCIRISSGVEESAELFETMKMLIALPEVVRGIGECAARHICSNHSLDRVADRFWETLCATRLYSR